MTHRAETILYALFDSPEDLNRALNRLESLGVTLDDVSVLMNEETHDEDFAGLELTRATEGATTGGVVGGFLGAIIGGLAAVGSVASGGIGLLVMGPALALAATGGVIGGLIGHGIPEMEAKRLQSEIANGRVMLAVHVHQRGLVPKVETALAEFNAERVTMPRSRAAEALEV